MPIKFRCNYCRQFLGISRAQAGGVVDCPTCGRSIRVPLLDGSVQPMPNPELDIADTHLARALDELARLADTPIQKSVSLKSSSSEAEENEAENQIPQPLPEPIPIEVPLPPTPVIVQSPANIVLNSHLANGTSSDVGLLEELAALSAAMPATELPTTAKSDEPRVRQQNAESTPTRFSIMMLAVFLSGMLTERFVHLIEILGQPKLAISEKTNTEADDSQLSGRITYKTKEGETLPDRGARVLVFPQQRTGEVKLSTVGFRPADSATDQLVADAALKALGGGAASVSEQGTFQLPINAGSYHLLIISHYQAGDRPAPNQAMSKLLAEYFDKPDELIGKVQYQFSTLRIKGSGDIFDHSF